MLLDIHEPGQTPLPHASDKIAVGIDLGTTHSLIAIAEGAEISVFPDEEGRFLLPSVVAYGEGLTPLATGYAAESYAPDEVTLIRSVKRLMGRSHAEAEKMVGAIPLAAMPEGEPVARIATPGGRAVTPVQVSAEILKSLKSRAEAALGKPVEDAVITVPAYFDDAARIATKDAARLAGLNILRIINEPTAAAYAYGLDKGSEGLYAVYDLGGGTFDVSVLRMEMGVFQVLATGGDTALGGDDMDAAISNLWQESLPVELQRMKEKQQLMAIARIAKERLTDEEEWQGEIILGATRYPLSLNRTTLEQRILPLVEKTLGIFTRVMEDAAISPSELNGVILVGGSTRVPLVRHMLANHADAALLSDIDPDQVVAKGAALQAGSLTQGTGGLLLDVIPLSLGTEIMGGLTEKIIHRNTPIPVAAQQEFTTYQDGQTGMQFHIVQGEREMAADCRSLAHFELKNIPPMKAGAARVKVIFTVDADGLLTVSAAEESTGTHQEVVVKPSYGLKEGEIEHMLLESMKHGREDMELRLFTEAKVEAEGTIAAILQALKADSELVNAQEEAAIATVIAVAENAIIQKNREAVNVAMQQLEAAIEPLVSRQMDKYMNSALKGRKIGEVEETMLGQAGEIKKSLKT